MKLEPDLTCDEWSTWTKLSDLNSEVVALYGAASDVARETLERLLTSVENGLAPLKPGLPKTIAILSQSYDSAYFVEMRFPTLPNEAGKLYLVIPLPNGYCSFCMHDCASRSGSFPQRIKILPAAFQKMAELTTGFNINYTEQFANLSLADVYASSFNPHFLTTVKGFVSRKTKSTLKALFRSSQSLEDFTVLAHDHKKSWYLFFQNSEKGDQSVYLGLADETITKVVRPLDLYDELIAHYLTHPEQTISWTRFQEFCGN